MSQNMPCERCQRAGLLRLERIITGTDITLSYCCGACGHTWQVAVPDPRKIARAALRRQKDRRETA